MKEEHENRIAPTWTEEEKNDPHWMPYLKTRIDGRVLALQCRSSHLTDSRRRNTIFSIENLYKSQLKDIYYSEEWDQMRKIFEMKSQVCVFDMCGLLCGLSFIVVFHVFNMCLIPLCE